VTRLSYTSTSIASSVEGNEDFKELSSVLQTQFPFNVWKPNPPNSSLEVRQVGFEALWTLCSLSRSV